MESIQPLSKSIYDKAMLIGIDQIILRFSGGSDEGFLEVDLLPWEKAQNFQEFAEEVEGWAWDHYDYSGAGDGSDYGDTITYDLKNKTASTSEWYTARTEGESEEMDLEFESDEGEPIDQNAR